VFLVIGLGNPELRYVTTRHNIGFVVVDRLAAVYGGQVRKEQFGSLVDKVRIGTSPVVLAKPQKYMNRSGGPTSQLRSFYKVPNEQILVVHDDMDLGFGRIAIKAGGGHGGHNGLRDLIQKLGDRNFVRIRFGVGRPPKGWDPAKYVLGSWTPQETEHLLEPVERAIQGIETVIKDGTDAAMNVFNVRDRVGKSGDPQ